MKMGTLSKKVQKTLKNMYTRSPPLYCLQKLHKLRERSLCLRINFDHPPSLTNMKVTLTRCLVYDYTAVKTFCCMESDSVGTKVCGFHLIKGSPLPPPHPMKKNEFHPFMPQQKKQPNRPPLHERNEIHPNSMTIVWQYCCINFGT